MLVTFYIASQYPQKGPLTECTCLKFINIWMFINQQPQHIRIELLILYESNVFFNDEIDYHWLHDSWSLREWVSW